MDCTAVCSAQNMLAITNKVVRGLNPIRRTVGRYSQAELGCSITAASTGFVDESSPAWVPPLARVPDAADEGLTQA
jgi:hypothetical protein